MFTKKNKIMLMLHLPPPVNGVSVICENILKSPYLSSYDIKILKINLSRSVSEQGRISPKKFLLFIYNVCSLLINLLFFKPNVVYFVLYPQGKAFYYKDLLLLAIIKVFKIKVILHIHNLGISKEIRKGYIQKKIYTWILKGSTLIFVSATQKNIEVNELDLKNINYYVLRNGVEKINVNYYRKKNNSTHINILYFSNLFYKKGVFFLISTIKNYLLKNKNIHLTIAGGDHNNNMQRIETYIKKNKLNKLVTLEKNIKGKDKWFLFGNADIFIFPSYFEETSSLVLIEAMQFGLPIIASNTGAIKELLINEECGILFRKKNPKDLLEVLEKLINDKKLRNKMSKKARNCFLNKYTLNQFHISFDNILKKNK